MNAPTPSNAEISHKEALVSLTALHFIEEHHLLPSEKLVDAKNSLQALFLRTSGEETLLRKLIDILKTTQGVQRSFARIASILDGIRASAMSVESKITALRSAIDSLRPSAEENAAFVDPFLSFSQTMGNNIGAFARALESYLQAKEEEARATAIYVIARAARDRLKQRLSGGLGAETQGEVESRIKNEVVSTFDYSEAGSNLSQAQRESGAHEDDVRGHLNVLKAMCQRAMNPAMRDKDEKLTKAAAQYDDVFVLFSAALRRHPHLLQIKDHVIELLKMYQKTYGMYHLDFQHLKQSIGTMLENTDVYFQSKDEDRDIRVKRDKLRRIEALIPFLEHSTEHIESDAPDGYVKFSKRISELLSRKSTPWADYSGDLLRAKIQAEAELNTRL